jgi:hypothetical protein
LDRDDEARSSDAFLVQHALSGPGTRVPGPLMWLFECAVHNLLKMFRANVAISQL